MRNSNDVIRSLKRAVWLALPGYSVIFDGEEGTVQRPFAVVKSVTPEQLTGSRVTMENLEGFDIYVYPKPGENAQDSRVKAGEVKETLTQVLGMGIVNGAAADGGVGRRGLIPLYDYDGKTWKQGIEDYAATRLDGPLSLPTGTITVNSTTDFAAKGILYLGTRGREVVTYTGKTPTTFTGCSGGEEDWPDNALVQQFGSRLRPDYAKVKDLSVHVRQSPGDETLYSVLAEVRLGWTRGALLPSDGEMADSVTVSFNQEE